MARDDLYHRFAGRSDWQRNNDGRFRTLWRHCRALRRHCYYTLLLAYLCAIGIGCVWYPDSGGADFNLDDVGRPPRHFPLPWFPLANNPWGRQFNPQQRAPAKGFDVYYFDLKAPTRLVARERVHHIFMEGEAVRHGIAPNDFAAYWAGTLYVPVAATYTFNLQAREARVLLDGHVVYLSESGAFYRQNRSVTLAAGDYLLEVESGGNETFALTWQSE